MARGETSRGRVMLFVLMLVVAVGVVAQDARVEWAGGSRHPEIAAIDADLTSARITVANLRAAQAGYIAMGQSGPAWMAKVDHLTATLAETLTRRENAAASIEARTHYEEATATLDDFKKLDARARSYVHSDQTLFASDAIFQDSLQATGRLDDAIEAAALAERRAQDAESTRHAWIQIATNAGGLTVLLIGGLILLPRKAPLSATETALATPELARPGADVLGVGRAVPSQSRTQPVQAPRPVQAAAPVPVSVPVNLAETADLCLDLARLLDGRDMPSLFERAARVLDAKGLVLWAADSSGAMLRPTLTHGYPEKVVARIGALQVDGENATALAFRTLSPQLVSAPSPGGAGAIAVPLITATGCVGVLSAEITRPQLHPDSLSVARLIAAQLSALIGTEETGARTAHG